MLVCWDIACKYDQKGCNVPYAPVDRVWRLKHCGPQVLNEIYI